MSKSKTLIGCPVHSSKKYCWEKWVEAVNALDGDFDVMIIDNSDEPTFNNASFRCFRYTHFPSLGNVRETVAACQEMIRKYAADHDYDYLLMLEQDNIIAPEDLNYLISLQKPIVGIPYWKFDPDQKLHYVVWQEVYNIKGKYEAMLTPVLKVLERFDGNIKPVFNIGLGCLLISKEMLKTFKFRVEKEGLPHSDTYFAHDIYLQRVNISAVTDRFCEHLDSGLMNASKTFKALRMLDAVRRASLKKPVNSSKRLFLTELNYRMNYEG